MFLENLIPLLFLCTIEPGIELALKFDLAPKFDHTISEFMIKDG